MSVFKDKKYEELDWISQATEPIESNINDYLSRLPDKLEITIEDMLYAMKDSFYSYLRLDKTLKIIFQRQVKDTHFNDLSYDVQHKIVDCFSFEIEGEPELNYLTNSINNGKIFIVKSKAILEEDELKHLMIRTSLDHLINLRSDTGDVNRYKDIFEVLGECEDGIRSRSIRNKRSVLYKRIKNILEKNEWNIKSHEVAEKMTKWIVDYLRDGNLAAYSNFCRLKVMTHLGQPIYSIQEVK